MKAIAVDTGGTFTDIVVFDHETGAAQSIKGDVLWLETGGAGGVGPPTDRDPERVRQDMENGLVTEQAAGAVYGRNGIPQ